MADVRKVEKPKGRVRLGANNGKIGDDIVKGGDCMWLQEVKVLVAAEAGSDASRLEGRWAGNGKSQRVVVAEIKRAGGKGWVKEVDQGIKSHGLHDPDGRLIKTYLSQLALPQFDLDNTFEVNQILRSIYLSTLKRNATKGFQKWLGKQLPQLDSDVKELS